MSIKCKQCGITTYSTVGFCSSNCFQKYYTEYNRSETDYFIGCAVCSRYHSSSDKNHTPEGWVRFMNYNKILCDICVDDVIIIKGFSNV